MPTTRQQGKAMDVAQKKTATALKQLEAEFTTLDNLLTVHPIDKTALEQQVRDVDAELERFIKIQDKYTNLLIANGKDQEYEAEEATQLVLRKRRNALSSKVSMAITPIVTTRSTTAASSGAALVDPSVYRVKLPQRQLPKFSGDVRQWRSFWASFQELDTDNSIPDIEKYNYLSGLMIPGSPAAKVVNSFPADPASYKLAKDELEHRFGKKNTLIKVYVRDLLALVVENAKEKKNYNFIDVVTSIQSQILSLEQLGVTQDKFGLLLYPIIESCIPVDVLQRYLDMPGVKEELKDIMEFLRNEVRRREETSRAQEAFGTNGKEERKQKGSVKITENFLVPTAAAFINTTEKVGCGFCSYNHNITDCRKAISMTLDEKRAALQKSSTCFKCLKVGHQARKCTSKVVCNSCKKNHHSLMCRGKEIGVRVDQLNINPKQQVELKDEGILQQQQYPYPPPQMHYSQLPEWTYGHGQSYGPARAQSSNYQPQQQQQLVSTPRTEMANYIRKPEVLLQTLLVKVYSPNGYLRIVRAMIDTASQSSYIKESLAKDLRQQSLGKERVVHQYFGAILSKEMEYDVTRICISGIAEPYLHQFTFMASIKSSMAQDIIAVPSGPWIKECADLNIPLTDAVDVPYDVEIFIGNDVSPYLKVEMRSKQLPSGIIATETRLGWFLEGRIPGSEKKNSSKAMVCVNMHVSDKEVESYWALETIGIKDADENRTRAELEEAALIHFRQTVKRDKDGRYEVHLPWIEGDPSLPDNKFHVLRRLEKITRDLIRDGYLQDYHNIFLEWEKKGIIEKVPVDKPATGVIHYLGHRAVYKEGSTTPVRPVFNASGKTKDNPSLNDCLEKGPNLLDLIPSILTKFRIHILGIIADILKAFLQMMVNEKHRDCLRFSWWEDINERKIVVEYRHCRVVFGVSSSPFLLMAVIMHLLDDNEEKFPDTVGTLRSAFYVDNCVTSLSSLEDVVKFKTEAQQIFQSAQMDLRGWEYGPSAEEKMVPVLGLIWKTGKDTLSFDLKKMLQRKDTSITKRSVLQLANSLYDPLGLLSPFVIVMKMIFKRVCCDDQNYGWDAELAEGYKKEVECWKSQLEAVSSLAIPRCMTSGFTDRSLWSLHVMADASRDAYACCIYLRIESDPVIVQLVQARARVTPKTVLTIPRAELVGCLIATRLYNQVKEDLDAESVPVTFWSDSTTALAWIKKTDAVWGVYVNRRVQEIRKSTNIADWKHVPGELNPADLPSRGTTFNKYLQQRWWEGPDWLRGPKSAFPNSSPAEDEIAVFQEKKKTVVSALNQIEDTYLQQQLLRIGDWHKILRVVSVMFRFVEKARKISCGGSSLEQAENALLAFIQRSFANQPPPENLQPRRDANGILRVTTKLVHGEDSFIHPVLLPGSHPLVKLLIQKEHAMASHAGIQYMMSILREKYWIVNSRRSIKSVLNKCSVCRVHTAKRCKVVEAPLPLNRVKTTHCFATTGVDLAGPLVLKGGQKVWIVLFTCAVYRAVHLEMVTSLSTEAFMVALRKFVVRRGRPSTIYSDNGTNFTGCSNLFKKIKWTEVEQYAAVTRINWIFNAPTASWWGGWWERLVGLMKQLLRRVLGSRCVNYGQLEVLVLEVEAVLNERPLTYISEDPADLQPLTPSLFTRDLPVACLPEADVTEGKLRGSLRHIYKLRECLRSRFRKEYLAQLIHSGKAGKSDLLAVGDVVLVEVDNRKRIEWPIGVVQDLYPGRDGVERTAKVRTTTGEIIRPLQRLFPLEVRHCEGEKNLTITERVSRVNVEADEDDIDVPAELLEDEPEPIVVTRYGRNVKKPTRLGIN